MITKNAETEFDRLIQARLRNTQKRDGQFRDDVKPKYTTRARETTSRHPNFHRDNYRPDPYPTGRSRSANYANFFARSEAKTSQELAESKFTLDPVSSPPTNGPAAKRYTHQGKTYKEEPSGKK